MTIAFQDKILDLYSTIDRKRYMISDIDWFCRSLNGLFNSELNANKNTEHLVEQFKQKIGSNVHLVSKRTLKKLQLNDHEVHSLFIMNNHVQRLILL
jgi:hypothetical protein